MTLAAHQIDLVRTLQASLPTLQLDEIDAHLDYNKFLGDAGVTFDTIITKALAGEYESAASFVADLRSVYIRMLGWYFSADHKPLRARLYQILDEITNKLSVENATFFDIYDCREALDRVYQYNSKAARRFAFDPNKYAENVIEEWRGSSMSLFDVLTKLETYKYRTVAEFSADLRKVGQTLLANSAPRTLVEMAQYIVDVANGLESKKSWALTASAQIKKYKPELHNDPLNGREYIDHDVSPLWKLAPVPRDETPYSQHIRRLMVQFEAWVADIPLDNLELLKKTANGETLEEWKNSVKNVRGSAKGVTNYIKGGRDDDEYAAMEYCWITFLHLLERERLDLIRARNVHAMQEYRARKGAGAENFAGKEGPLYRASLEYKRDILCQYHSDFYKFWGQTPTWAFMEAVIAYNKRDEDYHDNVMEQKVGEYIQSNIEDQSGLHADLESIHGGEIDPSKRTDAFLALKEETGPRACQMWNDFSRWLKEDKIKIRQSSGIIVHEYRKMCQEDDIKGEMLTQSEMDRILSYFIKS